MVTLVIFVPYDSTWMIGGLGPLVLGSPRPQ